MPSDRLPGEGEQRIPQDILLRLRDFAAGVRPAVKETSVLRLSVPRSLDPGIAYLLIAPIARRCFRYAFAIVPKTPTARRLHPHASSLWDIHRAFRSQLTVFAGRIECEARGFRRVTACKAPGRELPAIGKDGASR